MESPRVRGDASWQRSEPALRPQTEQAQKDLHDKLDAHQLRTFTRWWNSHLAQVDLAVEDLCEDIKPGVVSAAPCISFFSLARIHAA